MHAFTPQQKSSGCQLPSEVPTRVILEQELDKPANETYIDSIFAQVGWPNIGPVAAEPAGPAPTALYTHTCTMQSR